MNKRLLAMVAITALSTGTFVLGATPAMAAEGNLLVPIAVEALAATSSTSPDETPAAEPELVTQPIESPAPTPESGPIAALDEPFAGPILVAPPAEIAAQSTASPAAPVAPALKMAALQKRPGPNETGYTYCWELHPELPNLDPYDARTWPANTTCTPAQDQVVASYTTISGSNRTTGATTQGTVNYSKAGYLYTGVDPTNVGDTDFSVAPGQTIDLDYSMALTFPSRDEKPMIDSLGNSWPRSDYTVNFEGQGATLFLGNWDLPTKTLSSVTCNDPIASDVAGTTVIATCHVSIAIPADYSFSQWIADKGELILPQLTYNYRTQFDYPTFGGPGPWSTNEAVRNLSSAARIQASLLWLPTAQNQKFRIKASEILTVTPEGLLTGAQWSEGSVDQLDTVITNVPEGGTVTPEGYLEFTSEQVGDYDFNYFLQDPTTQLRSQDATGEIEVYTEAVAVDPPVVVEPPIVTAPPVIAHPAPATPVVLASTGFDGGFMGIGAALALLLGIGAMVIGRLRKAEVTGMKSDK